MASVGFSRWGVLGGVVVWGLVIAALGSPALAEPPIPWRSRPLRPAPYSPYVQRQSVPGQPRTRWFAPETPAQVSQSLRPVDVVPSEPVSPEPTPDDSPTSPPPRSRRTYYIPRQPVSLFPAGHGIHIAVSQKFLDELIQVDSQNAGPVRDCILGAEVVGSQQTETSVHVRLVPSDSLAQLEFQLTGVTRNSTENRTPQAVIQSEGNHRFEVSKSVQFDGLKLLTRSPSATLYPCQTNRSARTPASAIPILGPLVAEYALGVAEQSRPAAERITAQRITEQVVPQFNQTVDQRLATLNTQWAEEIPKHLPKLGIRPPTTRVRTTQEQLTISFAWDTTRTCPEYVSLPPAPDVAELRVAVHAEAVNAWLASLPLGGQEIPISELDRWQKELERVLSSDMQGRSGAAPVSTFRRASHIRVQSVEQSETVPGLGEPTILGPRLVPSPEQVDKVPAFGEPERAQPSSAAPPAVDDDTPASQSWMILAKENPVTVEFGQGEAVITLVAAFRITPAPQTADHRIRIPLTSRITPEGLIVTAGTVRVESMPTSTGPLAEIFRATIEQQVQQRLQPTRWPIERQFDREPGSPVTLRLGELSSAAGWLTLVWGVDRQPNEAIPAPE